MTAVDVMATVRVEAYRVISDAVERGIMWGWQRSIKHLDPEQTPDELSVKENMEREIMSQLCEVLDFGD